MISINEFRSLVVTIYLDPAQTQKKKKKKKSKAKMPTPMYTTPKTHSWRYSYPYPVSGQLDKGMVVDACTRHEQSEPPNFQTFPHHPQAPPPKKNIPKRQDLP